MFCELNTRKNKQKHFYYFPDFKIKIYHHVCMYVSGSQKQLTEFMNVDAKVLPLEIIPHSSSIITGMGFLK